MLKAGTFEIQFWREIIIFQVKPDCESTVQTMVLVIVDHGLNCPRAATAMITDKTTAAKQNRENTIIDSKLNRYVYDIVQTNIFR